MRPLSSERFFKIAGGHQSASCKQIRKQPSWHWSRRLAQNFQTSNSEHHRRIRQVLRAQSSDFIRPFKGRFARSVMTFKVSSESLSVQRARRCHGSSSIQRGSLADFCCTQAISRPHMPAGGDNHTPHRSVQGISRSSAQAHFELELRHLARTRPLSNAHIVASDPDGIVLHTRTIKRKGLNDQ